MLKKSQEAPNPQVKEDSVYGIEHGMTSVFGYCSGAELRNANIIL